MASLILAGKIMSLLLILFVGFLIVRLGILSSEDARVVSRLTIYAVTPCTIITSYQVSFTPDIRDALLVTLAAGVITQMFYTFISLFYTKLLKLDEVEHAAIVYSNSLNLIVPLVSALLGPQWVIYASMYSSFQTFMMWSNGKSILCGERRPDFRKVFKNINIISVFIGIFIMILGITEFPGPIQSAMNSLGSLVGAMGMLNKYSEKLFQLLTSSLLKSAQWNWNSVKKRSSLPGLAKYSDFSGVMATNICTIENIPLLNTPSCM